MQDVQYKIGELEKAKVKMLEQNLPDLAAKIELEISKLKFQVSQKKNDSQPNEQTGGKPSDATASEASSEAFNQSSDFPKEVDSTTVVPNSNSDNRVIDSSSLDKKWIGVIHADKFDSLEAYHLFIKAKNRLKTVLVNWLNSKRKRDGIAKKNLAIDLSKEMARLVKNDAKKELRDEILSKRFLITDKKVDEDTGNIVKTEYFYGCDEKLINNFFK